MLETVSRDRYRITEGGLKFLRITPTIKERSFRGDYQSKK